MNVIDISGPVPATNQSTLSRPTVPGPAGPCDPARLRHRGRRRVVPLPHAGQRGPPAITVVDRISAAPHLGAEGRLARHRVQRRAQSAPARAREIPARSPTTSRRWPPRTLTVRQLKGRRHRRPALAGPRPAVVGRQPRFMECPEHEAKTTATAAPVSRTRTPCSLRPSASPPTFRSRPLLAASTPSGSERPGGWSPVVRRRG